MNIVHFGASGTTGSFVLREILQAGHHVTAVVRDVSRLQEEHPHLEARAGDVLNTDDVHRAVEGQDAVACTVSEGLEVLRHSQSQGIANIILAMKARGVQRLICMGGSGIWQVSRNHLARDKTWFPRQYAQVAAEHFHVFQQLQRTELLWTQICPPHILPLPANGLYKINWNTHPTGTPRSPPGTSVRSSLRN